MSGNRFRGLGIAPSRRIYRSTALGLSSEASEPAVFLLDTRARLETTDLVRRAFLARSDFREIFVGLQESLAAFGDLFLLVTASPARPSDWLAADLPLEHCGAAARCGSLL